MTTITRSRGRTVLTLCLIAALLLAFTAQQARADSNSNPGVLPPNSHAFGNTYGGWSAAWWQYVESQSKSSNPLVDPTGAGCRVGQSGPVFFLVGTNGSGATTRDQCTVPAVKALFFPLVNAFDVHVPVDGLYTPQKVWDDLHVTSGFSINFSSLFAKIDNLPVSNLDQAATPYRACAGPAEDGCTAPALSLTFPADNFFGIPAGTYSPAVADGVYLLVAPLAPGTHTITFGGTGFDSGSFSQDITYNLVVSPR
ncbi:MAG: hypothetical protein JWO59_3412 [Chloroflexi bacterium]|nr:hypothetical protein [Chloroflexota bacterium]